MEEKDIMMNEQAENTVQQPAWEVVPDPIDMEAVEEAVEDALEDAITVCIRRLSEQEREVTIEGGGAHADLSL